ncbi:MAG TPA: hypothetical protein DCP92_07245 [Nitrospiraceae bacterium]|nr:hypothetical protein [Nitrospiraceae bacterium]
MMCPFVLRRLYDGVMQAQLHQWTLTPFSMVVVKGDSYKSIAQGAAIPQLTYKDQGHVKHHHNVSVKAARGTAG